MNTTTKTNGTAQSTPDVLAALAALTAALTAQQAPAVEAPAPVAPKPPRKPRAVKAVPIAEQPSAMRGPKRAPVPEDHTHTVARFIEAVIPEAKKTRSGIKGSGLLVHVECICGLDGWLEIPARDAECICETAMWNDPTGEE